MMKEFRIFIFLQIIFAYTAQLFPPVFGNHGLNWVQNINITATLSDTNRWSSLPTSFLSLKLKRNHSLFVSYNLRLDLRYSGILSPLPNDEKYTIQIRTLIDSIPIRQSSSHTTTYFTERHSNIKLASYFPYNFTSGNHTLELQWKKTSTNTAIWQVITDQSSGFNYISVTGGYNQLWSSIENKDKIITQSNIWTNLTNALTFTLDQETYVTFLYSLTAQPLVTKSIIDRKVDQISTRIYLDGYGYREGSDIYGINSWNPSCITLNTITALKLLPGTHTAVVQWMKQGSGFKAWGSYPSLYDGYASSRNFFIFTDYGSYLSPMTTTITPIHGDKLWHTIDNSFMSFILVRQSAVLFAYDLPTIQRSLPTFDSNRWAQFLQLQSRLLIDNIPYDFSLGTIATDTRVISQIEGKLGLIMQPGTHTVVAQIKASEDADWMTLYDMANGNKIVAIITSENQIPLVTMPPIWYTNEEQNMRLQELSLSIQEYTFAPGIIVSCNVSVDIGQLNLTVFDMTEYVQMTYDIDNHKWISLTGPLQYINEIINNIIYIPKVLWYGDDTIRVSIVDISQEEEEWDITSTLTTSLIHVTHIDHPFTLNFPNTQNIHENETVTLQPILLNDLDNPVDSYFRVKLTATCGLITLTNMDHLQFWAGTGVRNKYIDYQGLYKDIMYSLVNISYTENESCPYLTTEQSITLQITDLTNHVTQQQTLILHVNRYNTPPEIKTSRTPYWILSGIKTVPDPDYTSYSTLRVMNEVITESSDVSLNYTETLSSSNTDPSNLIVFDDDVSTQYLTLRFDHSLNITLYSSSNMYIPKSSTIIPLDLHLTTSLNVSTDSYTCRYGKQNDMKTGTLTYNQSINMYTCLIITDSYDSYDVLWLYMMYSDYISNILPLVVIPIPQIQSIQPMYAYSNSSTMIHISAEYGAFAEYCQVNDAYIPLIMTKKDLLCPVSQSLMSSFSASSSTNHLNISICYGNCLIKSNTFEIQVCEEPYITNTKLDRDTDYSSNMTLYMNWDYNCVQKYINLVDIYCIIDDFKYPPLSIESTYVVCSINNDSYSTTQQNIFIQLLLDHKYTNKLIIPTTSLLTVDDMNTNTSSVALVIQSAELHLDNGVETMYVYGDNFPISTAYICHFSRNNDGDGVDNSSSNSAYWISSTILSCPLSTTTSTTTYDTIYITDRNLTSNFIKFAPLMPTIIQNISPRYTVWSHEEVIDITGTHFTSYNIYTCIFGNYTSIASYISDTKIICVSPIQNPQTVNLSIYNNETVISNDNGVDMSFTYLSYMEINSVTPLASPLLGGSNMTIHGHNFMTIQTIIASVTDTIYCQFNENITTILYILSDTECVCMIPSSESIGYTTFNLILNDGIFTEYDYDFLYFGTMSVTQITPDYGNILYEHEIFIYGNGFVSDASYHCHFGEDISVATYYNSTTLSCTVPVVSASDTVPFTVSINDYELNSGNTDMTYSFIKPADIIDITPRFSSVNGDNEITFIGVNFKASDVYQCIFGSTVIDAIYKSNTIISCITPPHSKGLVDVKLYINGIDSICKTNCTIIYTKQPLIEKVTPDVSPTHGGSAVAIIGINFDILNFISSSIHCIFNDIKIDATYLSSTTISCVPPPYSKGYVSVSLLFNSNIVTNSYADFYYFDDIQVKSVTPILGGMDGGDELLVFGDGFIPQGRYSCVYGNISGTSPAWFINSTLIGCNTPASTIASKIPLLINMNDYLLSTDSNSISNSNSSVLEYEYVDRVHVTSFSPMSVDYNSYTTVMIYGTYFDGGRVYTCVVDDIYLHATYVSHNTLSCDIPPHNLGQVSIKVMIGNSVSTASLLPMHVQYVSSIIIDRITPLTSLLSGGDSITLYGNHFDVYSTHIKCVFADNLTTAVVTSPNTMMCAIPSHSVDEIITLTVTVNDVIVYSTPFRYVQFFEVTSVSPTDVSVSSGSAITIYGLGFISTSSIYCIIDDIYILATVVNFQQLNCITPLVDMEKDVIMTIIMDGLTAVGATLTLHYFQPSDIIDISPKYSTLSGGNILNISGIGFDTTRKYECIFDHIYVDALYISDSLIQCQVPVHSSGIVSIRVLENGVMTTTTTTTDTTTPTNSESLKLTYVPTLTIESMSPRAGSNGSDIVTFHTIAILEDLFDVSDLYCQFGDNLYSKAQIISEQLITCSTPPLTQSGTYEVSLVLNTIPITNQILEYTYLDPIRIDKIRPSYGSSRGDTLISIYGQTFPLNQTYACLFGTTSVVAWYVDDTTIQCITPRSSIIGAVPFSLILSDYILPLNDEKTVMYEYIPSVEITAITPTSVYCDTSNNITVTGTNFYTDSIYTCHFDHTAVRGQYLSSTEILCMTPMTLHGTTNITVYEDDILIPFQSTTIESNGSRSSSSSNQNTLSLTLSCKIIPSILSIFPYGGPATGGSSVTLFTTPLIPYSTQMTQLAILNTMDISCYFDGIKSLRTTSVSPTTTMCLSPPSQQGSSGSVNIELRIGGTKLRSNGTTAYRYFDKFDVYDISPHRGTIYGRNMVTILGDTFISSSSFYCVFDGKSVPARVLNETTLTCIVPSRSLPGQVKVDIIMDGYVSPSFPLQYEYTLAGVYTRISPTAGICTSQNSVKLIGYNFSIDNDYKCDYGTNSVLAYYITSEELICVLPTKSSEFLTIQLYENDILINTPDTIDIFQCFDNILVTNITPQYSLVEGGTVVNITMVGVPISINSSDIYCSFGDQLTPANVTYKIQKRYIISCISPRVDTAGLVDLNIHLNDIIIFGGKFNYLTTPTIFAMTPTIDSYDGQTAVSLYGNQFISSLFYNCIFGNISVEAFVIHEGEIKCTSPSTKTSSSNDSIVIPFSVQVTNVTPLVTLYETIYTYVQKPVVQEINYCNKVSNMILLKMTYIDQLISYVCVSNLISYPADIISENVLLCMIPRIQINDIYVAYAINRNIASLSYSYKNLIQNDSLFHELSLVSPDLEIVKDNWIYSNTTVNRVMTYKNWTKFPSVNDTMVTILNDTDLLMVPDIFSTDTTESETETETEMGSNVTVESILVLSNTLSEVNITTKRTRVYTPPTPKNIQIDSITPKEIPFNGTWIDIYGESFTITTQCHLTVQNLTLSSYVFTTQFLRCYVPPEGITRSNILSLLLYDVYTNSTSSLQTLTYQRMPIYTNQTTMTETKSNSIISSSSMFYTTCDASSTDGTCTNTMLSPISRETKDNYAYFNFSSNFMDSVNKAFISPRIPPSGSTAMISTTVVDSSSTDTAQVDSIYPSILDISNNHTDSIIYIHGKHFLSSVTWCIKIRQRQYDCLVQYNTQLICHIPYHMGLQPGIYDVNVLSGCADTIGIRPIQIVYHRTLDDIGTSGTPTSTNTMNIFSGASIQIYSINPLLGSVSGNTPLTITGTNLKEIDSCLFIRAITTYTIPAIYNAIEDTIICYTPSVDIPDYYKLSLHTSITNITISTRYNFMFYSQPTIRNSTQIILGSTDYTDYSDFIIYGEDFPTYSIPSCHIESIYNQTHSFRALVLSSITVVCQDSSSYIPYIGPSSQVYITFNKVDYIKVPVQMSVQYPRISPFISESNTMNDDSNLRTNVFDYTNTHIDYRLCDTESTVIFDQISTQQTNISCTMNEHMISSTQTRSDSYMCTLPPSSPGLYTIKLKDSTSQIIGRQSIQCLVRPKFSYVRMLEIDYMSGVNTYEFHGTQISPLLPLTCIYNNVTILPVSVMSVNKIAVLPPVQLSGYHTLSLMYEDVNLYTVNYCLDRTMIRKGVHRIISSDSYVCVSDYSEDDDFTTIVRTSTSKSISDSIIYSVYPREGTTNGNTLVTIYGQFPASALLNIRCEFGSEVVGALPIKDDTIVCISPSYIPGNTTLRIRDNADNILELGWYSYYLPIKLLMVTPHTIPRNQVTVIKLLVANMPTQLDLYCYIEDIQIPAIVNTTSLVFCAIPALSTGVHSVTLGTRYEKWSNTLEVQVLPSYYSLHYYPTHGTIYGGSYINITLPNELSLNSPTCLFGTQYTSRYMLSADLKYLLCEVPSSMNLQIRNVDVYIIDSSEEQVKFYIGQYHYEYPAEIYSVQPTHVVQGQSARLLVQGSNFINSLDLCCIVNNTIVVIAQWESSTALICVFSENITSIGSHLLLSVSNNKYDISMNRLLVTIDMPFLLTTVYPQHGFISGGTPVKMLLQYEFHGNFGCIFSGSDMIVPATQYNGTYYTCLSAVSYVPSTSSITLVDNLNNVLAIAPFQYYDIPIYSHVLPSEVLLGTQQAVVDVYGNYFHKNIVTRFRNDAGGIVSHSCTYNTTIETMKCVFIPSATDKFIFMDVSVNNVDYIQNFMSFEVIQPLSIISTDIPEYIYHLGGQVITFVTNEIMSQQIICQLTIGENREIMSYPAVQEDMTGTCTLPTLPLFQEVSWSLYIKTLQVLDPVALTIYLSPIIETYSPDYLLVGMMNTLEVQLFVRTPTTHIECLYDNLRYEYQSISPIRGICHIQPYKSGTFILKLVPKGLLNYNTFNYTQMNVSAITYTNDYSVKVVDFIDNLFTTYEVTSPSCSILPHTICYSDMIAMKTLSSTQYANCSIQCQMMQTTTLNILTLNLCHTESCASPYYTTTIQPLHYIHISHIYPNISTTEGRNSIHIYGFGFTINSYLMCTFDSIVVPLLYVSDTEAICIAPPHSPGVVQLVITSHNILISNTNITLEYFPYYSNYQVIPSTVLSTGGTPLTIYLPNNTYSGPFNCRFNQYITSAITVDETTLQCISPKIEYPSPNISFTLNSYNRDISTNTTLEVIVPPNFIYISPTMVHTNIKTTFNVYFDSVIEYLDITCITDDRIEGLVTLKNHQLTCQFPLGFNLDTHILKLSIVNTTIYTEQITVTKLITYSNMRPTSGSSKGGTAVYLTATTNLYTSLSLQCCIGDSIVSAEITSSNVISCNLPSHTTLNSITLPIGIQYGTTGICENTGYNYTFIYIPDTLSSSPLSGPVTGGTQVSIQFTSALPSVMYCRLGLNTYVGIVSGMQLTCITRMTPAGLYPIEVSVNNIDYSATDHYYDFVPLKAKKASPYISFDPIVSSISPTSLFSGFEQSVYVYGRNIEPGAHGLLGDSTILTTQWINANTLKCIIPSQGLGSISLRIVNSPTKISDPTILTFASTASIHNEVTYPSYGSMKTSTNITIHGSHLNIYGQNLSCLIGDTWSSVVDVTENTVTCVVPPSRYSGIVKVRVATMMKELLSGIAKFEYIRDSYLFDMIPRRGYAGTKVLIQGSGFTSIPQLSCMIGDREVKTIIISNNEIQCEVPFMSDGKYPIQIQTNGQYIVTSGLIFEYYTKWHIHSIFPNHGPAMRGNTIILVYGEGFINTVDIICQFGDQTTLGTYISSTEIKCVAPPHYAEKVHLTVYIDKVKIPLTSSITTALQYMYVDDVSINQIIPTKGSIEGGYPVFIIGENFINVTSLGCKFADMISRATFISNNTLVCLAPSHVGKPQLFDPYHVSVEVTTNGYDYTNDGVIFTYNSNVCDKGYFCPGMISLLCPNGTYCEDNSRNYTLCQPGTFQPQQGQFKCIPCPIGYICPDHGMARPLICPAGQVCDITGLRWGRTSCPAGFYCPPGTKSLSVYDFYNYTSGNTHVSSWMIDTRTGIPYFNTSTYNWNYTIWPSPATGQSRTDNPPTTLCDHIDCMNGVIAEAPLPCPLGYYCRAGVSSPIPIPKNFSTPQVCYDGFFCPRGSTTPEGSGPCPNGYFCPDQTDAIPCLPGHYCPGVGNTAPLECYPGTYNPYTTQGNCTVCPTGHICPGWGMLYPEPCPAGFVCISLGLSVPILPCPAGFYCPVGTMTTEPDLTAGTGRRVLQSTNIIRPILCPPGVFCLGGVASFVEVEWIPSQPWGATSPQQCNEGTFCASGASKASGSGLCYQGHYCPPNAPNPIPTPLGKFSSGLGSVAPNLCFPGTYAALESQAVCTPCPAGHTCPEYGTYLPTICPRGTYRSLVDTITCKICPSGTYSDEMGVTDISFCYPCPPGRVCSVPSMTNLTSSATCSEGYLCGYGTYQSTLFLHQIPAGFYGYSGQNPSQQYDYMCEAGYACSTGTTFASKGRAKCTVGYYCPPGTPVSDPRDLLCPQYTTSLAGSSTLPNCRILPTNVCAKISTEPTNPSQDVSYIDSFSYTPLDDPSTTVSFNSATIINGQIATPTGEVRVVQKIWPINMTSSTTTWVNDTIEAFRTCPSYGAMNEEKTITIIGRNFIDTKSNFCRFRACLSANYGYSLGLCRNQIPDSSGKSTAYVGKMSSVTIVRKATYISPTRIQCTTPQFISHINTTKATISTNGYECHYIDNQGTYTTNHTAALLAYVRRCDTPLKCSNLPLNGYQYYRSLTLPCSTEDIANQICNNKPHHGYMYNPCYTSEVLIEVSNDAEAYSGGDNLNGINIVATAQYGLALKIYKDFKNYTIPPTFAVYTYVIPTYMTTNNQLLDMDMKKCLMPRYEEEADRDREKGWYMLPANYAATITIDLTHLPSYLIYNEHYRVAVYAVPSRCTSEACDTNKVQLSMEDVPCRKPIILSDWFLNSTVPKNVMNNFTIYSLDDLLFHLEIELLYGMFTPTASLFENTTTIIITGPSRASSQVGLKKIPTRKLSPYTSYTQKLIPDNYFFVAVYALETASSVTQPLNLPPLYAEYERGRVLSMYNASFESLNIPLVLGSPEKLQKGPTYWLPPASSNDASKEMLDAYFETFHGVTYDKSAGYDFSNFDKVVLPYLPYFSNCYGYDSYIPIWMLTESQECSLPMTYTKSWYRYKYPALPDQDNIKYVGPYDVLASPIADWCVRDLYCHYEEDLNLIDSNVRWFEAPAGTELFSILRSPMGYNAFHGRADEGHPSPRDAGGGIAITKAVDETPDNLIPVIYQRINDNGCTLQCMPRSLELNIAYYQTDKYNKRIILATLTGSNYDTDTSNTNYTLSINYNPLGYIDLVLNFAFSYDLFVVLYVFLGVGVTVLIAIGWVIHRLTTYLATAPEFKFYGLYILSVPPAAVGTILAMIPVYALTSMGNLILNGYFYTDPNRPQVAPHGSMFLDSYNLAFNNLGNLVTEPEYTLARNGRMGSIFFIIAMCLLYAGTRLYYPRKETRRELDIAKKWTFMAEKKTLWTPIIWKKCSLVLYSFLCATFWTLLIEFAYWGEFGAIQYQALIMAYIIGIFTEKFINYVVKDRLLTAPIHAMSGFAQSVMTFGSSNFLAFLLQNIVQGCAFMIFDRIYLDKFIHTFVIIFETVADIFVLLIIRSLPKYMTKTLKKRRNELIKKRKQDAEGGNNEAESVEPIIESYLTACQDTLQVFFFPYFIYLLMQYRTPIGLPALFNIPVSDMIIYMFYQISLIIFQPLGDIFIYGQLELFNGWKIYEYLVYSRYRFLQRETRWKGLEDSLDECIEEEFRRLDQMCFSSQFYFMLAINFTGIVYIFLAYECWLRADVYSPFSDSGLPLLWLIMICLYLILEYLTLFCVKYFKVWKTKHESTDWHYRDGIEDEDIDIPEWEDIKGPNTDIYLMNKRINSDTFRYKFLNYNRSWLVNQLPEILTPRTLRRSRPYLISQLSKILSQQRGDISDDSDNDENSESLHKFGPVTLSATSKGIIRYWLGKAKRRIQLKIIVDPLIRKARQVECEQCLSTRQLQVEYEISIDEMASMYDSINPNDTEINQAKFKSFWSEHQKYHTYCLPCITRRKEDAIRNKVGPSYSSDDSGLKTGRGGRKNDLQEDYPDWGPVFLTEASNAILLKWVERAKISRQQRKQKRKSVQYNATQYQQKDKSSVFNDRDSVTGGNLPLDSTWSRNDINKLNRANKTTGNTNGINNNTTTPTTTTTAAPDKEGMNKDIYGVATRAIAIKWMRTARARLQKKIGRGGFY